MTVQGTGVIQEVPWGEVNVLRPFFTPGIRVIDEEVLAAPGTFTFTGLDQAYRDLMLACQLRSDDADGVENDLVALTFNNDGGANYDYVAKYGRADNVFAAGGVIGNTYIEIAMCEAANSRANVFTPFTVWVQGYRFTDREKIAYCSNSGALGNRSALADLYIQENRGAWRSQNAITRVDLNPVNGTNFAAGSRVTVYGRL